MNRLLAAALLIAGLFSAPCVYAQNGFQILPGGCGTGGYKDSAVRPGTQNPAGQQCTNAIPYLISTGYQAISISASTGISPPAGSNVCYIQAEGNSVRFRTDGVAPTASTGQLMSTGALLTETANLSGIRFIPTTGSATLDVDCYK